MHRLKWFLFSQQTRVHIDVSISKHLCRTDCLNKNLLPKDKGREADDSVPLNTGCMPEYRMYTWTQDVYLNTGCIPEHRMYTSVVCSTVQTGFTSVIVIFVWDLVTMQNHFTFAAFIYMCDLNVNCVWATCNVNVWLDCDGTEIAPVTWICGIKVMMIDSLPLEVFNL